MVHPDQRLDYTSDLSSGVVWLPEDDGAGVHVTAGQDTPRDASSASEGHLQHVNSGSGGAGIRTLSPPNAGSTSLGSSGTSSHRGNPPPHTFSPHKAAAVAAATAAAGQSLYLHHHQNSGSAPSDYSGTLPLLPSLVHSQQQAKRAALGEFALSSRYSHTSSIHHQTHNTASATTAAVVVATVCDSPSRASLPPLPPPPQPPHPPPSSYTYPQQQHHLQYLQTHYPPQQGYYYPYGMPGSTIPENQSGTGASPTEAQTGGAGLEGMRKSPPRARLTEQEKKNNHIASEQKRRNAIRDGFDRLTELIPGCEGQGRSEGMVLNKCELLKLSPGLNSWLMVFRGSY